MTRSSEAGGTASASDEYDVFISHATKNATMAARLCDELEGRGFRCWIAPRDVRIGKDYPAEIIRGIETSQSMILMLSEAANASTVVQREVERATNYRKPIFTMRIEDVKPAPQIELFLSTPQWTDAWRVGFERAVDELAHAMRNFHDDAFRPIAPRRGPLSQAARALRLNLPAIAVLGALLLGGAAVYWATTRPAPFVEPAPEALAPFSELAARDFDVRGDVSFYGRAPRYRVDFTPVGEAAVVHSETAELEISVDDRPPTRVRQYGQIDITGGPVPQVARLRMIDAEGGVVGPFQYPLDLPDQLDAAIDERIARNRWVSCRRSFSPVGRCEAPFTPDFAPRLAGLWIGSSSDALTARIDVADPARSVGVAYRAGRDVERKIAFFYGSPANALYAQLEYADGSRSEIKQVSDGPSQNLGGERAVFELTPETPGAPAAFVSLTNAKHTVARGGSWDLDVVGDLAAGDWAWSVEEGVWTPFDNALTDGYPRHGSAPGSAFGVDRALAGGEAPPLRIRLRPADGATAEHVYRGDWAAWLTQGAKAAVDVNRLFTCRKAARTQLPRAPIAVSCALKDQHAPPAIVTDILYGASPDALRSVDSFEAAPLLAEMEAVLQERLARARSEPGADPDDIRSIERGNANTLILWRSDVEKDYAKPWRQRRLGSLVAFTEPLEAVYFQVIQQDGSSSEIVRVPVR